MIGSDRVEKFEKKARMSMVAGLSEAAIEGREEKRKRVRKQVRRERKIQRQESARIRCGGYKV